MSKEPPVGAGFETRFSTGEIPIIHACSRSSSATPAWAEDDSNERLTAGAPDETVVGDGSART